jgi:hypothetical protein
MASSSGAFAPEEPKEENVYNDEEGDDDDILYGDLDETGR